MSRNGTVRMTYADTPAIREQRSEFDRTIEENGSRFLAPLRATPLCVESRRAESLADAVTSGGSIWGQIVARFPGPIPSNKATRRSVSFTGVFQMYPRRTCLGIVNNLSSRASLVSIRLNVCSRDPPSCNKQIRSPFQRLVSRNWRHERNGGRRKGKIEEKFVSIFTSWQNG